MTSRQVIEGTVDNGKQRKQGWRGR